jgi:hypothetical protein
VDKPPVEEAGGLPVTINKYPLLPNEVVLAPRGQVLLVGFAGNTAYAWVMHHPMSPVDMQILTVPSQQIINIETDPLFEPPVHIGSCFKTDKSGLLPSAWHCFAFMPKNSGAIILPN